MKFSSAVLFAATAFACASEVSAFSANSGVSKTFGTFGLKSSKGLAETRRNERSFALPVLQSTIAREEVDTADVTSSNNDSTVYHGHTPSRLFEGAKPIQGKYGLRCPNVDLRKCKEWSKADIAAVLTVIQEAKGVLTFPNQSPDLSPDDQLYFASLFGEPETHTAAKGIPGYPQVLEIIREKDAQVVFGEDWHSDHSFQPWPASFSFLRATGTMTPVGTNNTQFAHCIEAWKDLSPTLKKICLDLKVSHSARKAYGTPDQGGHKKNSLVAMQGTDGMKPADKPLLPDQFHPVVINIPETGEEALFVSTTFTNGIVGMTDEEGNAFIKMLQNLMTQEQYLFEVSHEPHQVTMWDNRQLIHRGLVNDASSRRIIQRVSVSTGSRPTAVNGELFKEGDEKERR
mmetsp:Transcript_29628/g.38738  ORF Transcript_29628/g.38738 Transcript_29628/m.38738 type:complete len:401 (-) Transcript_29628:243-1445(-)